MQKPLVVIENWAVVQRAKAMRTLIYETLQPGGHLLGKVVGHATLANAEYVYTSPIQRIDANQGRVETRNTVYQLGKPSERYLTWEQERKVDAAA